MVTIPVPLAACRGDASNTLETQSQRATVKQEHDTPLVDSASGFSIFSDVARPLRHLGVEQLQSREVQAADVIRMRLAKPRQPSSPTPLAQQTSDLIARRYSSRGFNVAARAADPNLYTFAAYESGQLVGTVSMRFDSPAGLVAEQLYRTRSPGSASGTCDCANSPGWRSMNRRCPRSARVAVHSCYLYSHIVCGLTHAVIEVNPRHVAFYRRVLHFKQLGEQRHNLRVDAPAVLLSLDFSVIAPSSNGSLPTPTGAADEVVLRPLVLAGRRGRHSRAPSTRSRARREAA